MIWLKTLFVIVLHQPVQSLAPACSLSQTILTWDFPLSAGGDSSSHSCQTNPGGLGRPCLGKVFSWKLIFNPIPGKSKG